MSNVLIVLVILALFAGFLVWMSHHYGDGGQRAAGVTWLGRLWDGCRDFLRSFSEPESGMPAQADVPAAAPVPPPPPPPAARNGEPIHDSAAGRHGISECSPGFCGYWDRPARPSGTGPPDPAADGTAPMGAMQSDVLHTIGALVARASNGDIRDVRRVIKTLSTAADALGHGVSHLGTRLAEPDKHYGPEIWEPLTTGGAQLRAASLHCAQSDAMVTSLLATTVGELADSPRQAPHHRELNGPA